MTNSLLSGQRILVTRPAGQTKTLTDLIIQSDGQAIHFPVIEIVAYPSRIPHLEQFDWLVFISPNAVTHFFKQSTAELPAAQKVAAVGSGTAKQLQSYGVMVDCLPTSQMGSGGLLDMPEMKAVNQLSFAIIRGVGGRELLADTLRERGANIHYIEVYQRICSSPAVENIVQATTADKLICTSVTSVQNLCTLLKQQWSQLTDKPMVVLSDRIRQYAHQQGFKHVVVAEDAGDAQIVNALIELG